MGGERFMAWLLQKQIRLEISTVDLTVSDRLMQARRVPNERRDRSPDNTPSLRSSRPTVPKALPLWS